MVKSAFKRLLAVFLIFSTIPSQAYTGKKIEYTLQNRTQLLKSIMKGDEEYIGIWIANNNPLNFITNNSGNTPLHYAIAYAYPDKAWMATLLIENGAPINIQNKVGYTPLHTAALQGSLDLVHQLLDHGASVMIRSNHGTPWAVALKMYSKYLNQKKRLKRCKQSEQYQKALEMTEQQITRYREIADLLSKRMANN